MSAAGGRAFVDGARLGVDERELQWDVERAILRAGADRLAFPTLVFSGNQVPTGIGFARWRVLHAASKSMSCAVWLCVAIAPKLVGSPALASHRQPRGA
jgi:hypothetical protein